MKKFQAELYMGKITVTANIDDLVRHKVIKEFSPEGKLLSSRTEYSMGIPPKISDPSVIAQCFFEALIAESYLEAASYLSPALRENIPDGQEETFFRGFFEDFVFAYPEKSGATALIIRDGNGYKTKRYTAEIENGFIINLI